MGGAGRFIYPRWVYNPTGGWWPNPNEARARRALWVKGYLPVFLAWSAGMYIEFRFSKRPPPDPERPWPVWLDRMYYYRAGEEFDHREEWRKWLKGWTKWAN
eukprot:TRINITY_DN2012_c0_g1::TRINITY_DN2012_c0_g1_i1::g.21730::m.21730 TRINITY_DN2012_c0_g1::TRINITY_DN2012_c0_g1_i1::g.21730  ORF type:complete len:120 (-),score=6.00 TRINITY_DN2012_c0_g1_i1:96-401(-)